MALSVHHAAVRFGLGRRPVDPLPDDPRVWLRAQLASSDPLAAAGAEATRAGIAAYREDRRNPVPQGRSRARVIYRDEATRQLGHALTTEAPFRERLVWFWTNHFTVSLRRGECAPIIGSFVNEAIRPHVTGSFADMLLAVARHPAMLFYLDNNASVGPNSPAGRRGNRGLNENLAREIMELHTLSPQAGYSQQDVTEVARVLTGWSVERDRDPLGYVFRRASHEPGEKRILGKRFPEGEAGGEAVLRFFATHPATHRHLATRLVRHFVADVPPPDAVRAIEGVLRDTGGDLDATSHALIGLDAAWQPLTKLRPPQDWVVAALRALDLPQARRPDMVGVCAGLGQPVWTAPAPDGWPDTAGDWTAPEAMMRRIDWASTIAGRAGARNVTEMAQATLGPLLSATTLREIGRAGSVRDAVTLLLASPEFQRR